MKPKFNPIKTALLAGKRLQKTASVAGLSALRVAKGEPVDANLVRETFEQLGVTYIKLGQFIASTPSLFPKDYVLAFADLLDNTTPIAFDSIKQVLDSELAHQGGVRAFASIDPVPLASASIAQVHKAVLPTGEPVAIKIQKPNVATVIHTDLSVLHAAFWALEKIHPTFKMVNLAPIVDEIKKRMLLETDFVAEQTHLNNFGQFLRSNHIQDIVAPSVYANLSSKKVLTMTYFDGISLVDEQAIARLTDPKAVMNKILQTWFLSLTQTGEFHADLHAGNLMLLKNGTIGFLDFGLVGKIDPKSLQACMTLALAFNNGDFKAMAEAMIAIGMTDIDNHTIIQSHKLADELQDFFTKTARGSEPGALLTHLVAIGKQYGIHFPQDFALLMKQLLYFDRFLVALAPDMMLFDGFDWHNKH